LDETGSLAESQNQSLSLLPLYVTNPFEQSPAQAQKKSALLANARNTDVTGVHNENDTNMFVS
jgi:hypothetical protein